jgi:hypothetical protein
MAFVDVALHGSVCETYKCTLVQLLLLVHEDKEHTERVDRVPT